VRFAILGGGVQAKAVAGSLALAGHAVNLSELDRYGKNIEPLEDKSGLMVSGVAGQGFARLDKITTNIPEAVSGVEVIMVIAPPSLHEFFAEACASYLEDGQIVLIVPGNFSAIRFNAVLKRLKVKRNIPVAETESTFYLCSLVDSVGVAILAEESVIRVATLPATETNRVVRTLARVLPQIVAVSNVWETSINNVNIIEYPAAWLLNMTCMESGLSCWPHVDGAAPSVRKLIEAMDHERMAVAKILGIPRLSVADLKKVHEYMSCGGASGMLPNDTSCKTQPRLREPDTVLFHEELGYGLVPLASIATTVGLASPAIRAVVQLASAATGIDYWQMGLTARKLGITGLSLGQLIRLAEEV